MDGRAVVVHQPVPEGRHALVGIAGQPGKPDLLSPAVAAQKVDPQHHGQDRSHQDDPAPDLPLPDLLLVHLPLSRRGAALPPLKLVGHALLCHAQASLTL